MGGQGRHRRPLPLQLLHKVVTSVTVVEHSALLVRASFCSAIYILLYELQLLADV
jgi:hypothetical protein